MAVDREALIAQIGADEQALHHISMRWADGLAIPADLTIRQLQLLFLLRTTPGIGAQQLAEQVGVSSPTMSGILDRVVGKGWVEREPDPSDRRRHRLALTPAGEELMAALENPAYGARERLAAALSDEDLELVARAAARLLEAARAVAAEIAREGDGPA